jgi:tight adherence protein B
VDPSFVAVTVNGETLAPESWDIDAGVASTVPAAVVLAIDTSASMEGAAFEAAKDAAISFIGQKGPEDFVAIVTFDDEATTVSDFNNSSSQLVEAIEALELGGGTVLYDGLIRAADLFADLPDEWRKNIVVLADGDDNVSDAGLEDAVAAIRAAGARTFGVALELSSTFSPEALQQIAEEGEGLFLSTSNVEELTALYGQIQRELNRGVVIRLLAGVKDAGEVEVGIRYGSLVQTQVAAVSGFVTATTAPPATTTTIGPTALEPFTVTYDLPVSTATLLLVAVIGLGGAVGLFIYILFGTDTDGTARFGQRLAAYGRRGGLAEERRPFIERIPLLNRFTAAAEEQVRKRGLLGAVNATLEQGNVPLAAGEAIAAAFGLSAILGLLVGLFTANVPVGITVFVVAVILVFVVINFIGGREKRRFEGQLPDTLTLLSTSLRAGYSLLQAIEAVAQEAPNPTAREFGRSIAEARLGRQVNEALDGITIRTQSKDFEWAAMAIEIQREVGGNLAEVLQTVADTMLARNRLKGEIKALTAEGRISAIVLGALPFAIGSFLWLSNPTYLQPLFDSTFGLIAIGAGLTLMLGGMLWLRKIVNIEV